MPAIAKTNDLIIVIIIFVVELEEQQELINSIIEFINTAVKYQPGFVSTSFHSDLIHLAEFRVKPENQQHLVELEKEYVGVALQNSRLISANHHSLDGTRIMNYGQWRSWEDFELLLQDPKYKPLSEYWQGLAENEFHLYEVVFTKSTTN